MIRAIALLAVLVAAAGCGSGVATVSPIVEYNAAQEAYARNEKILSDVQGIIQGMDKKDPKLNTFLEKEKEVKEVLAKLRQQVSSAYRKL